jgi:polyhydroxybutyrate depolymerase
MPRRPRSRALTLRPLALALLVTLASCTARFPPSGEIGPGTYVGRFDQLAGGFRRTFRVHVPAGSNGRPLPVVVVLHGAFSSGESIESRSGFSRLADEHGFIVVYPDGYGFFDYFRHWNAGFCCGQAMESGIDDVAFIDAILDEVTSALPIDRERIYVVGESNGGMLAHLYAAMRSRRIAAAAAAIATIGAGSSASDAKTIPGPEVPVPMAIIHGRSDDRVPFVGGTGKRNSEIFWVSPVESAEFWARQNATQMPPTIDRLYGGRVERTTWHASPTGAPVVLLAIDDWDHRWPGVRQTARLADGDPLRGFDAATVVWSWLSGFRRPAANGSPR